MNCNEAEVLLHAMLDGELDASHAREVETHVATCPHCTARLRAYRDIRQAMAETDLRFPAPASLRRRIDAALPAAPARVPTRRALLQGFGFGAALSAVAASGLVWVALRADQEQRVLGEVVAAHLRSLQADHLTDVPSSDRHTVKPWFNGRLDLAPPVVDLTAQGFTLLGGRLDYIDGRPVASIVYRRRIHVINLFVAQASAGDRGAKVETVQGFNIRHWTEGGLSFWAVSDINADELQEFGAKFEAAARGSAA